MDGENSIHLSAAQQEKVFEPLRRAYSDFAEFPLIAETLKRAIFDVHEVEITRQTTKKVAEIYYNKKAFYTPEMTEMFKTIKDIFKAAYVLVLYHRILAEQLENPAPNPAEDVIWSMDTFRAEYPEFDEVMEPELHLLLQFRNMVKVCTLYIAPRLAKQVYLRIAGRLEGSQCAYITGGGQRQEVTNRVLIYEREGGVAAEPRPDRVNKFKKPTTAESAATLSVARIVSHSDSGDNGESESAKKRRNGAKRAKETAPDNEAAALSTSLLRTIGHRRSASASASYMTPPLQEQERVGDDAASEPPFSIPLDWTNASELVASWKLPKEESFISALLKGEINENPYLM